MMMNQETKCKSRKQSQENEETDDQTNFFDQLHDDTDTVIDIVSRLPITSLVQFSFVSRSSKSLCQNPHVVDKHLSRSSMDGSSSCLILHSNNPIQNELHFLQLCDGKLGKLSAPFVSGMPEFGILGSSNGLLCLINTSSPESMHLYNPFTRNHVELAKNLDYHCQDADAVYGYGFSPATKDYKVIKIVYCTCGLQSESDVQIYSLRRNVWEKRGAVPYLLEKWSSPGVVVSERVHWVSESIDEDEKMIVSCDLADDSFHAFKQPGAFSDLYAWGTACQLAELDGGLCAAIPSAPGFCAFDLWIMREYGVTESWMKAYSIEDHPVVSMISFQMERSSPIWRSIVRDKVIQILCVMKSGELLMEYRGAGLVLYDFRSKTFKELKSPQMPRLYQTTFHVGSLKSANLQICNKPWKFVFAFTRFMIHGLFVIGLI